MAKETRLLGTLLLFEHFLLLRDSFGFIFEDEGEW